MDNLIAALRRVSPLVHCITNTVTENACANALLAAGARPIMAICHEELREICAQSDALLLNTGTITAYTAESILTAARLSRVPTVLDCVGASASHFRLALVNEIISVRVPNIIKGNASEIAAVCGGKMSMSGVDAAKSTFDISAVTELSKRLGTTVMVTGENDFVASPTRTAVISNGCPDMARVTGTGCITGCLAAALAAVSDDSFGAAARALTTMGVCGEAARCDKGTGTFYVNLIDALSTVTDEIVNNRERVRFI